MKQPLGTEVKTENKSESKQEITVSVDLFNQLKERLDKLEKQEQQINLTQHHPQQAKAPNFGAPIEEEFGKTKAFNITKDDYLKEPVRFVRFGRGWVLSHYFDGGQEVLAPYNRPIVFKGSYSDIKNISNNSFRVIPYCEFDTHSKAIAQFIRDTPYYKSGIIYENAEAAMKGDFDGAMKIEQATALVSRLSDEEIFGKAMELHLSIDLPVSRLKGLILQSEVDKLRKEEDTQKDRIRQRTMEEEIFTAK